jgi:hypothetical protein
MNRVNHIPEGMIRNAAPQSMVGKAFNVCPCQ